MQPPAAEHALNANSSIMAQNFDGNPPAKCLMSNGGGLETAFQHKASQATRLSKWLQAAGSEMADHKLKIVKTATWEEAFTWEGKAEGIHKRWDMVDSSNAEDVV